MSGPARSESSMRCESMRLKGFNTASVFHKSVSAHHGQQRKTTHLCLNMTKIDTQLLQQRRLPIIPLGRESSNPPSPQPSLFAQPTRNALRAVRSAREALRTGCAGEPGLLVTISICAAGLRCASAAGGRTVLRREELKVLGSRGAGAWVLRLLVGVVV